MALLGKVTGEIFVHKPNEIQAPVIIEVPVSTAEELVTTNK